MRAKVPETLMPIFHWRKRIVNWCVKRGPFCPHRFGKKLQRFKKARKMAEVEGKYSESWDKGSLDFFPANFQSSSKRRRWDNYVPKLTKSFFAFKIFPKLYPYMADCVIDSDIGYAICSRAEDLPSRDNKSCGVNGDSAAIGKARWWNSGACLPRSASCWQELWGVSAAVASKDICARRHYHHRVEVSVLSEGWMCLPLPDILLEFYATSQSVLSTTN